MAYGNESWVSLPLIQGVVVSTDWGITGAKADTITGGEVMAIAVVPFKCVVKRTGFRVSTVAAGTTTTPVIKFHDGAIGASPFATLTVGTAAAGTCIYEDPSSLVTLEEGSVVTIELDVADVGGSPTSEGFPFICVEQTHETPANNSSMTAG